MTTAFSTKSALAAVVAAGTLLAAASAHAVPTIKITSPGDTDITIADNGAGDTDSTAGIISFSETIGTFTFVGSTAFTKPFLGVDAVQLDTVFSAFSNAADSLTLYLSDTGFDATGNFAFSSKIGGTTQGSVQYDTFVDNSNTLFGQAVQVGSVGPFGSGAFSGDDSGNSVVASPFSMTQAITITHSGGNRLTTGDANLQVPVPATLGLLGLGLVGLGAAARFRRRAA